jgi:glycine C-acetyltransferase/8-amino-7-oxononanoate synthase
MESAPGARTLINGRWRDYFAGCSYLGLPGHPELVAAAVEALRQYGLTTATSRGGFGEHPLYQAVEASAARFFQTEQALYYVSGYLGNAILAQGLRGEYDHIFVDSAAHFSVYDGIHTVGLPVTQFRHRDADDLAAQCRARLRPGERPLVISDGVFPVSGEIAPVPDYLAVLAQYPGAILCLDDAHATGVIGAQGQGTWEYWASQGPTLLNSGAEVRVFTAHTLSKALGGHGGVIAGDGAFIEQLRQRSTTPGATSPPPLPAAAASAWALNYVKDHPELRQRLWDNVALARAGLRRLGWPLDDTPIPIICLAGRPGLDLARIRDELFERDICVGHSTNYSSTPPGGALRIAIFTTHTTEQIERLIEELGKLL